MLGSLRREAKEFSAQAQRRAEARRQETGDAGGNDGDGIFINQGSAARTQMVPNHGHTSRIERQQFGRDLQEAITNTNLNSRQPLNNKTKAAHHVLFLAAHFQLLCQITTATTQLMDARKRFTTFVTKQAICTWRKKRAHFFVLTAANTETS